MLSGNRNFEGRVSPDVRANYLASPPLVVAYAIAGSMRIDLTTEALGIGSNGEPVFLKDIWPTNQEVAAMVLSSVTAEMFRARYDNVFDGDDRWQAIKVEGGATYKWNAAIDLCAEPALFRRHDDDADADAGHHRRAAARDLWRFDHHRSHLAGRLHQGSLARRALSVRTPGRPRRVQLLWRPPRQP